MVRALLNKMGGGVDKSSAIYCRVAGTESADPVRLIASANREKTESKSCPRLSDAVEPYVAPWNRIDRLK